MITGPSAAPSPPPSRPTRGPGAEPTTPPPGPLQWPLVGLAVILALLIVATPTLLGVGNHTIYSPETQPVLTLARGPSGNGSSFLVEGVSQTSYARIDIGLDGRIAWPIVSAANLTWTNWTNRSDTLTSSASTLANPVAINVTVEFVDSSGASVTYVAVYAFNLTGSAVFILPLLPQLTIGTPFVLLSDLPVNLPLLARGATP